MRDYAKVSPQFWIGPTGKRLRAAGPDAQIVAMYLMTSPHANMLGMYYCPLMFIAHETGLTLEGASKGLLSASEAGFCEYDSDSEVVWVIEMATYQIASDLSGKDLRIKGVQNEYNALPENPYLVRFFEKYGEAFKMESCRSISSLSVSPLQAPCKPLLSQEQEQEQEQDCYAPPALPTTRPTREKCDESETALQASCRGTLKSYASAYWDRYHAEPVVNAKVRSQIKQFCQRLSHDEAPAVAAFYVTHQSSYYVRKCHDVGSLLADAEKLRTEWATNRQVTDAHARQADRTQSNFGAADEAMRILEAQGVA